MKEVLLPEQNKIILGSNPVEWPEFLRFLGLLLLMATVHVGCDQRSWFKHTEPSEFEGHHWVNCYGAYLVTRFASVRSVNTFHMSLLIGP
jgi:hypothetical protein